MMSRKNQEIQDGGYSEMMVHFPSDDVSVSC